MGDEPVDPGRGRPRRGGGGIEERREGEEDTGSSGDRAGERRRRVLERARRFGEDPELTLGEPRAQVVDGGRAAQRGGQGELAEVPTDHLDPLEPPPQPRRHGIRVDQPQDRILGRDGRHDGPRGEHRVGLRGLDPPPAGVAARRGGRRSRSGPAPRSRRAPTAARRRRPASRQRGRPKRRPCPAGLRQKTAPVPGYHGGRPENCDRNTASARMWGLRNHRSATSTAELRASSMIGRPARPSATRPRRSAVSIGTAGSRDSSPVRARSLPDRAASSIHAAASAASTSAIDRAVSSAVSAMAIWTPSP